MKQLITSSILALIPCLAGYAQEAVVIQPGATPDQPQVVVRDFPTPGTGAFGQMAPYPAVPGATFGASAADVSVLQMNMMTTRLVPPTMLMSNQEKLKLTSKQVEDIKVELKAFQSAVVDIQWALQTSMQKLNDQMEEDRINERQTVDAMEEVLKHERDLKISHLRMLIRIRNVLDERQLAMLPEMANAPVPVYMGTFNRLNETQRINQ